jgi:uncharacterized membrane protein YdjX (TVP38/TMEM64 family)
MNKKVKIFLGLVYLAILITFLYFIFSKFDFTRINDFSYYKTIQKNIDELIGSNLKFNIILFFFFSFTWVVLLGFASPILLLSGILFGKWSGTFISTFSISIGALTLYIIASFFFKDLVHYLAKDKFSKLINRFQKNEFYYYLAFRFVGGLGMPFFLQNVLPVIFKMKNKNYFFASIIGLLPHFFIWNSIGAGINEFIKNSDSFSFLNLVITKEIYLPILIFALLITVSLFIKKKIFND